MAWTACLVCFISTASGHRKEAKNALGRCGASSGDIKHLSNLYSLDIYAPTQAINVCNIMASSGSTMVEQPTLDPLFQGSNPVKLALKGWYCLFSTEVHKTYTIKLLTIDFVHAYNINGSHCSWVVKREKINEKQTDPGFAPQLIDI